MRKLQKVFLENMSERSKKLYLESFKGNKKIGQHYENTSEVLSLKLLYNKDKYIDDLNRESYLGEKMNLLKVFKTANIVGKWVQPFGIQGKWIGVEIECYLSLEKVFDLALTLPYYSDYLDRDDIDFESFFNEHEDQWDVLKKMLKHKGINFVNVKQDGSLDSGIGWPVEFTLMTLHGTPMTNLKKLCSFLSSVNAQVDQKCGMHIHLDCRDVRNDDNKLALMRAFRLENSLSFLRSMVPFSRRENSRYCRNGMSPSTHDNDHRYYAINTVSLEKYETIEVRLHSGTTDFTKISNWINLCYLISRNEKLTFKKPFNKYEFYQSFDKFPSDLKTYCEARMALFKEVDETSDGKINDSGRLEAVQTQLYQLQQDYRINSGSPLRSFVTNTVLLDDNDLALGDLTLRPISSTRSIDESRTLFGNGNTSQAVNEVVCDVLRGDILTGNNNYVSYLNEDNELIVNTSDTSTISQFTNNVQQNIRAFQRNNANPNSRMSEVCIDASGYVREWSSDVGRTSVRNLMGQVRDIMIHADNTRSQSQREYQVGYDDVGNLVINFNDNFMMNVIPSWLANKIRGQVMLTGGHEFVIDMTNGSVRIWNVLSSSSTVVQSGRLSRPQQNSVNVTIQNALINGTSALAVGSDAYIEEMANEIEQEMLNDDDEIPF